MISSRILIQCYLWNKVSGYLSQNFFVNMVIKFPMYDLHDSKAKNLGDYLPLPFSDGCDGKQEILHDQLSMLLEA